MSHISLLGSQIAPILLAFLYCTNTCSLLEPCLVVCTNKNEVHYYGSRGALVSFAWVFQLRLRK